LRREWAKYEFGSNVFYIDQYYRDKIKAVRNRACKGVLEIGQKLTEMRDILDHEEFVGWVKQCGGQRRQLRECFTGRELWRWTQSDPRAAARPERRGGR
jgi:hypothetical protein